MISVLAESYASLCTHEQTAHADNNKRQARVFLYPHMHVAAHVAKERTTGCRKQLCPCDGCRVNNIRVIQHLPSHWRYQCALETHLAVPYLAFTSLLSGESTNAVTVSMARRWNDAALLVPAFMLTMR